MFWGLIMEPGRCYTQTVKVSFHVSMAALDISNSTEEPAQVMCVFEGRNYLLCTLNKNDQLQCPLDLNFECGTKVSFATNGKSHVHLTGYLTIDDEFDEEEEHAEEEEEEEVPTLTKKDKKRLKTESLEGPPTKKTKVAKTSLLQALDDADEETSDSDFDLDKVEEEEDDDDNDDEEVEEEEDEDENEEEEVSSLSEAESEEDEKEEEEITPKQNGIPKTNAGPKQKKKKAQEKEQVPKETVKKQTEKKGQQKPQPKKTVVKGGVMIQDLKEGTGEVAKNGKFVHVYYEGRLKDNNKMFDSTTKGPGFSFRIGKGEVIKGWDFGLVGMKVGGKRRIICPPNAAYGAKGSPPVIPPNSTLVFDVELKKIS